MLYFVYDFVLTVLILYKCSRCCSCTFMTPVTAWRHRYEVWVQISQHSTVPTTCHRWCWQHSWVTSCIGLAPCCPMLWSRLLWVLWHASVLDELSPTSLRCRRSSRAMSFVHSCARLRSQCPSLALCMLWCNLLIIPWVDLSMRRWMTVSCCQRAVVVG